MSEKSTTTPMMEQYHRIKNKHKDTLLFFRLGDFYEMFYEDAKTASSVLEIALTSRQKVPMCGVPYHAADSYLAKLLRKGFKVAICEQVEDARQAAGVVRREVVKVLTPGTAVEVELSEAKESSFIASLTIHDQRWGMAMIDLASGEMRALEGERLSMLADEIFIVFPKEVIFPEEEKAEIEDVLRHTEVDIMVKSPQEDWIFDAVQAKNMMIDHFQVRNLEGFGMEGKDLAVSAAGALLFYLKNLRKDALSLVRGLSYVQRSQYMILDATSIRNLELIRNLKDGRLKGSILDIIDQTVTSMGGRLLRQWIMHPLLDSQEIGRRLDTVEEFLGRTIERQELRSSLKDISDLERLTGKISLAAANARDLVALKKSLLPLPRIRSLIKSLASEKLEEIKGNWDDAEDIVALIEEAILEEPSFLLTEGGLIKKGYNREIDELREISHSGKTFIIQMERKERERTGIPSLKIRYNKVFGYYIDVTRPNLHLAPADYIRKQTLVNSERFITPELKEYEEKVLNAEQKIGELEHKLFLELRERISREMERLQQIASRLANLDVLSSMAELASLRSFNRPVVDTSDRIRILQGKHPVIECTQDEPFIPNDTYMDRDAEQILIVTGPNMGGKSTYLRQVAVICILAQMGSFVPALKAEIGMVDRIFTRIGAMDFLSVGQSTFMVEMLETANILNNATDRSLILLDEVGRGTSTFDGLSIAWAVAEYLHEKEGIRAKTLFATHYHELTELSLTLNRIKNYHVSVKEQREEIVFLRKIIPGPSDQSYGIHVARLAGIPKAVTTRAREILFNLEKKELDDVGLPRIAYGSSRRKDKNQLLLFREERDVEFLEEITEEIEKRNLDSLTPLEALNLLNELKEKIEKNKTRSGGTGGEK
jgi:DNA mismatch repair protein MutS